eukprot:1160527-Pelagomonas_calceolata.AAC.10
MQHRWPSFNLSVMNIHTGLNISGHSRICAVDQHAQWKRGVTGAKLLLTGAHTHTHTHTHTHLAVCAWNHGGQGIKGADDSDQLVLTWQGKAPMGMIAAAAETNH